MLSGIVHAHSGLRWILLVLLIATIVTAFKKWKSNAKYEDLDNKLSLMTLIISHIQLLLGASLFFMSDKNILENFSMSDPIFRFFGMEHTLGMLIAIILITLGRIQSKKITEDALKHKKVFTMFLIAFILIMVSIPWPFRNLGASLF